MKNFLLILLLAYIPVCTVAQSKFTSRIMNPGIERNHTQCKGKTVYETQRKDTLSQLVYSKKALYKTIVADKQKMDSLTYLGYDEVTFQLFQYFKYSFSYNEQENQIQYLNSLWSEEDNTWLKSKEDYTYDQNGNMLLRTISSWNAETSQWINFSREDYTYSGDENLIQRVSNLWNSNYSEWIPLSKTENSYDGSGNKMSESNFNWNLDSNQWINYYKQDYSYDTANHMIQSVFLMWNAAENQWIANFKYEYAFDSSGNMTFFANYVSYELVPQWQGTEKEEYSYDANNNLTLSVSSEWDINTADWKYNFNNEYTYNASGKEILSLYSDWNEIQNQWVATSKIVSSYDGNDNKILDISYHRNAVPDQWVGSNKNEYSYDAYNREIQMAHYLWSAGTLEWTPKYKNDKSYDSNSNMTEWISWTGTPAGWVKDHKIAWTFNNSFTLSDLILPFQVGYEYSGLEYMITSYDYSSWELNTNTWQQIQHTDYFYSGLSLTSIPDDEIYASVFPNPAGDYIEVSVPGSTTQYLFELYDINGQLILSIFLKNAQKLNVNDLPAGIYTYKIVFSEKIHSGKLIKR